jgi:hypothetical protein
VPPTPLVPNIPKTILCAEAEGAIQVSTAPAVKTRVHPDSIFRFGTYRCSGVALRLLRFFIGLGRGGGDV